MPILQDRPTDFLGVLKKYAGKVRLVHKDLPLKKFTLRRSWLPRRRAVPGIKINFGSITICFTATHPS